MGLAEDPEELIEGMAEYLMTVGFNTSFLDEN